MSLLAATTLGVTGIDQVRARISAAGDFQEDDTELRLIVQSYRKDTLDQAKLPSEHAQPLASTQRAVTREELREGVDVSFVQLPGDGTDAESVVVAWVERGQPNLEYDGMEARPTEGAYCGVAQRRNGNVVLRLGRS